MTGKDHNASDKEYGKHVRERMERNGGKLFLVDPVKRRALEAVHAWVREKGPEKRLYVTTDSATTAELIEMMEKSRATVIDTEEALKQAAEQLVADAGGFAAAHPVTVIAARTADGRDLLHAVLGEDQSDNGSFAVHDQPAPLCFSDLLATCEYDFVLVDDVYELLAFDEKPEKIGEADARMREELVFCGKTYYSPLSRSYRRLRNILTAAQSSVALADVVLAYDAVSLYAVLEMLHGQFSLIGMRKLIGHFVEHYAESCEIVCMDIRDYSRDDGALSDCLRILHNRGQKGPSDVDGLKEYFGRHLDCLSAEELFLRAMAAHVKFNLNGTMQRMETVELLENGNTEITRCLCEMFFDDPIRTAIETTGVNTRPAAMEPAQAKKLFEVFFQYGMIGPYLPGDGACRLLRLMRDDAGFEHFIRISSTEIPHDELCFSILRSSRAKTDLLFKCLLLQDKRAVNGKFSFTAPALFLTRGNAPELAQMISPLFPSYQVTNQLRDLQASTEKTLAVVNCESFRRTALLPTVGTVVFWDVLPDVAEMKLLMQKARYCAAGDVLILAGYDDMSGLLADRWQNAFLTDEVAGVPVSRMDINIKGESWQSYEEIARELEEIYQIFYAFTRLKRSKADAQFTGAKYNQMLSKYTLQVTVPGEEITRDFDYLSSAGEYFDGVFGNTATIGDEGENIGEDTFTVKRVSPKKLPTVETQTRYRRGVLFNACQRLLARACNVRENDCAVCSEYRPNIMNPFDTLCRETKDFFAVSRRCAQASDREQLQRQSRAIINNLSEDSAFGRLVDREVAEAEQTALTALGRLRETGRDAVGMFTAPYEDVSELREAVLRVYTKILNKYYQTLTVIFHAANEAEERALQTLCEGFAAARHD